MIPLALVLARANCFGNSGSFEVPDKIYIIGFSSVKNAIDILIGIALSQWIAMVILTILVILVHEHGISFHVFC